MTDDQRADALGCMGNPIIQTPHIDSLARRGVLFENAFVTTAICMTNRACVLTGQYAARHGVINFRTQFTPEQLSLTYPALLKSAGYRIGFIGKWGVGRPPKDLFHYNRGFAGQSKYYHKQPDGTVTHLTSIMGDQALEFLDGAAREKQQPFCLSVSFKAPHVYDEDTETPFQFDPALEHLYSDVKIPDPPLSDLRNR